MITAVTLESKFALLVEQNVHNIAETKRTIAENRKMLERNELDYFVQGGVDELLKEIEKFVLANARVNAERAVAVKMKSVRDSDCLIIDSFEHPRYGEKYSPKTPSAKNYVRQELLARGFYVDYIDYYRFREQEREKLYVKKQSMEMYDSHKAERCSHDIYGDVSEAMIVSWQSLNND